MQMVTANIKRFIIDNPLGVSALLLLALAVRIAALVSLSRTPYIDFLLWDERVYHTLASRIVEGSYHSRSVYEFSPLPIYLMAGIYKLFTVDVFLIRIFHIGLGVATCWAVYLLTAELGGKKPALLACLLAGLYQPFIFYSIVPLKTALSLCLFGFMVWAVLRSISLPTVRNLLLTGLFAGLCLNVRPNCLVLIPVIPVLVCWGGGGQHLPKSGWVRIFIIYCTGFLIAVSPFMVRNLVVAGVPAITTTQMGQNLYQGNSPSSPEPYYRLLPFAKSSPFVQGIQFTIEASRREQRKLSHGEASAYWTAEVLRIARENPEAFATKIARKLLAVFNRYEAADHYDIGFISRFAGLFTFPFPVFWIVMPLGIAGMAVTAGRSRKHVAPIIIAACYAVTLVVFFTSDRLRAPLAILFIPFAAIGLQWLYDGYRLKRFRRIAGFFAGWLALTGVAFIPLPGSDDMSAYYNTHAIVLNSRGREAEAIAYWEASSQMDRPNSAFANIALAHRYYLKKDGQKMLSYLHKVPDSSFAAAQKYSILAEALLSAGGLQQAAHAYRKSLDINSGQRNVRLKLVQILERIDPQQAREEAMRLRYILSFYDLM